MIKKKNYHCCQDMNFFLEENKVAINYCVKRRFYSIDLKRISAIQKIKYCPWCGKNFLPDLSDQWFDILEKEYGLEEPLGEDKDKVPEEFRSDAWWRKRGL